MASTSNNKKKTHICLAVGIIALVLLAAVGIVFFLCFRNSSGENGQTTTGAGQTEAAYTETEHDGTEDDQEEGTELRETSAAESHTLAGADNQTGPAPQYTEQVRAEAPYEHWLAAAVLTGISMNSPEFQLEGIYIASETDAGSPMDSQGVYVTYTADGTERCVYSRPLRQGRTEEPGTRDIEVGGFGMATYEEVSPDSMDRSVFQEASIEDINTLIEQLGRVTVFDN